MKIVQQTKRKRTKRKKIKEMSKHRIKTKTEVRFKGETYCQDTDEINRWRE